MSDWEQAAIAFGISLPIAALIVAILMYFRIV